MAFEMNETVMSMEGIGHVVANGSSIKNHGEKKVVGYAADPARGRQGGAALGKHKMNVGGNAVALDGERRTRIPNRKR